MIRNCLPPQPASQPSATPAPTESSVSSLGPVVPSAPEAPKTLLKVAAMSKDALSKPWGTLEVSASG